MAFWQRAAAFFAAHGITIRAVLTDNGACYRSRGFTAALGPNIRHGKNAPPRTPIGYISTIVTGPIPASGGKTPISRGRNLRENYT